MTDMWSYRDTAGTQTAAMVGLDVVASDASIGKIDEATHDAGAGYDVVNIVSVDLRQETYAALPGHRADSTKRPTGVPQPDHGPDPGFSRLQRRMKPAGDGQHGH
jgi:hypothetical protein